MFHIGFAVVSFKRQLIYYITFELICQQLFYFLNCYQMTVSSSPLRPILCNSAVFVLLTSQLVYISTSTLDCQHLFSPFLFFCFYIIDIGASHTQSPYIYYHTHSIFYKKYNTRETIGLFSYIAVKN